MARGFDGVCCGLQHQLPRRDTIRREAPMTLMSIQARVCVPLYSTSAIVLGKSTGLASSNS